MCNRILHAFAIVLLMAGTAIALARDSSRSPPGAPSGGVLALTHAEKKLVWRDLSKRAFHYYGVPWFETIDRWALPNTIKIKPVTRRAMHDVPSLAQYDFAVVEGDLLLVNPADRTVVGVIRPYKHVG